MHCKKPFSVLFIPKLTLKECMLKLPLPPTGINPDFSSIKIFAGQGTNHAADSEDSGSKLPQVVYKVDPAEKAIDSKREVFD